MHSGSSITPKHPAIPVSIGIASLVLEGRSSALDDSSVHASAASTCATSTTATGGGHGGTGDGSSNGAGLGDDEEDGGFSAGGRGSGGASSLQQCSLMAIQESSHKSFARVCCHTPDEAQRINLKLQQIRSSCPGTSKDAVPHLVTVSGEPSRPSGIHHRPNERFEPFPRATVDGGGTSAASAGPWLAHERTGGGGGVVMYSGFEKMNVLGTVSPIKNHHPVGNSFIHFPGPSGPSSSSSTSRKPVGIGGSPVGKQQQPPAPPRPREGPHCEQFLRKIGLAKPDATEGPEHGCSYRNKYCLRWQEYLKQLSSILTNGEAVCIEVYLGPENHTILLEQWILRLSMTKSPTTMTIQSLCAAIRSQLYFSQISAWTDLIKTSLEPDIFSHPRIKKTVTAFPVPEAKLDILFRIRTYDSTACFNEKPLVHNFPDATVADNFVIQVCLKSLPRLDRIPGIDAALDAAKRSASLQHQQQADRIPLACREKGKHRCAYRVELEEEEEDDDDGPSMADGGGECGDGDGDGEMDGGADGLLLTSAAISHREKQLLKYRKRMLKREKKKKAMVEGTGTSSGSSGSSASSASSIRNGSGTDASSYFSTKSYTAKVRGSSSIAAGGSFGCSNGAGGVSNGGCPGGAGCSPLTSSINSIQPPLYSSNDPHQPMMICDDRFHAIATNSKGTQTSTGGPVPFVASVATQTDAPGPVCHDCNRPCSHPPGDDAGKASQSVCHVGGSGGTNRDRHMQYFNEYFRTYDIINENCDKRQATLLPADGPARARGDVVAMDEGLTHVDQKQPPSTARRASFIVGGDGYEGDEDDDSEGSKGVRAGPGDPVQQSIQRATAVDTTVGCADREKTDIGGHGHVHGLNNNSYTVANNNIIVGAKDVESGGDRAREDGGQLAAACGTSECDTFSKEKKLDIGDCRLCKRQKTKHNFKLNLTTLLATASMALSSSSSSSASTAGRKEAAKKTIITASTVLDCGSTPPGCRRTLSESLVGHLTIPGSGNGATSTALGGNEAGSGVAHVAKGDAYGHYPSGGDLSPGDSPMLSSSTGAVGNGGVFTFEQMKSYRRAFSEDVIDTITTLDGRSLANSGRTEEDSTEDDGSSGDNEHEAEIATDRDLRKGCGCADRRQTAVGVSPANGESHYHRPHTSTPAANGANCKEPLYISCSETDCSVSTASSVSPHKKQILSCAAIGGTTARLMEGVKQPPGKGKAEDHRSGGGAKKQLAQYKSSSKINLNSMFCLSPLARDDSGFTSGSSPATSTSFPATSPIAIDAGSAGAFGMANGGRNSAHGHAAGGLFRYDFEETPVSPVAGTIKSKSAPAFPFSPPPSSGHGALSPRFLRNAQRQFRTRYPSERSSVSERSSIGSDEQLSDDDLSSYLLDSPNGGYCSPLSGQHQLAVPDGGVSPWKMGRFPLRATPGGTLLPSSQMLSKVFNRNLFKFGRAPLLGTLEESLLQRRLSPKFQVADFKVLLGASGSFCPTQLTIPVASYFYELPGQHLTTPYVCELRLPRKGYSIPRTGTVQATLLNPLGTVVRMFVVPYDFRDMPAMSTTFIRQRILACDDSSLKLLGKNIEQLSNAEQMKLLRYAIHLRFQTSRSGKLSLHTDIRLLISRRTDCDTAAAHAKNLLESPNELKVVTIVPENPKFSLRTDKQQ